MSIQPVPTANNRAESNATPPQRLRHRLDTGARVRRELARVYRSARPMAVDVADYSRLANMLALLHRAIETGTLEARVEALERVQENR